MNERAEEVLFREFSIRRAALRRRRKRPSGLPEHTPQSPPPPFPPSHARAAACPASSRDALTRDEYARLSKRAGLDIDYIRQVFQV